MHASEECDAAQTNTNAPMSISISRVLINVN